MSFPAPELGHFALALGVAFAFAQAILPLWGAWRGDRRLMQSAPALALGQMVALGTSYACLVWVNVVNDFSVLNVADNSHSLKPMLYRITGSWGTHEGSVLFW
ncbi:MAG: c-type cytochrome biogenesis protein CcmF, partial [Rhodospirillales bacterium]|nr:c-type cytochrome biogenesis protein CcmF [Rhodospirillales bacterium]